MTSRHALLSQPTVLIRCLSRLPQGAFDADRFWNEQNVPVLRTAMERGDDIAISTPRSTAMMNRTLPDDWRPLGLRPGDRLYHRQRRAAWLCLRSRNLIVQDSRPMIGVYAEILSDLAALAPRLGFSLERDEDFLARFERYDGWAIVLSGDRAAYPAFSLSLARDEPAGPDRFTPQMLDQYLRALGIKAFDETFYQPEGQAAILVEKFGPIAPAAKEFQLADLQGA